MIRKKMEELKKLITDALGNIEVNREKSPEEKLYNYNDGRYDTYLMVLGWINMIEKKNV